MGISRLRSIVLIGLVSLALVASLVGRPYAQDLGPTIAVKERHTGMLLGVPGVVGTAVGLTADGQPAVKVYTKAAGVSGVPDSLEGIPVVVEVTGELFALPGSAKGSSAGGKGKGGSGSSSLSPTSRWPRPVPIGVSTGNEGQCSAGTIGARVKGGVDVYALSNNHVYALENTAPIGSRVLQPGLYDTGCTFDPNNVTGTLFAFQPINFNCTCFLFCVCDSTKDNTIDAAIALSSTASLGNATPPGGYGTPNSTTLSASLGQIVQKYGRTTSLTIGQVTGINATILVSYSSGVAEFINQIVVQSNKPFIKPGDSGSLLVSDDASANPVGLLFAGNNSGNYAIANHIDSVLTGLGVTIDGK